jgi:hypothetical protein
MEKIVVLTGNNGDENLVNCLRMLFPECAIEVLEKMPKVKKENFLPRHAEYYSVDRMVD